MVRLPHESHLFTQYWQTPIQTMTQDFENNKTWQIRLQWVILAYVIA